MSSRKAILDSLRQNVPPAAPLPAPVNGIRFADPIKQFEETLTIAGGTLVRAAAPQDLGSALANIEVYANAAKVASLVPGIPSRRSAGPAFCTMRPVRIPGSWRRQRLL